MMSDTQKNAAQAAMADWLSDPHELGKAPAKIECVKEFDLHDHHYYVFRFKKSLLGKWLLGVCGGYEKNDLEHCGHIYSDMEIYDDNLAIEKSIAMVEKIRSYWMQQAKEL